VSVFCDILTPNEPVVVGDILIFFHQVIVVGTTLHVIVGGFVGVTALNLVVITANDNETVVVVIVVILLPCRAQSVTNLPLRTSCTLVGHCQKGFEEGRAY
jgi:hypothetical protein